MLRDAHLDAGGNDQSGVADLLGADPLDQLRRIGSRWGAHDTGEARGGSAGAATCHGHDQEEPEKQDQTERDGPAGRSCTHQQNVSFACFKLIRIVVTSSLAVE